MLEKKAVIVTGSTSGIGLKIAELPRRYDLALFLCSAGAAQIRGQALAIDGGWAAQ